MEGTVTAVDGLGYLAAGLVLATFCAKRMAPLRTLAIASNIAFVAYSYLADLWPILLLHSVMLPMNCLRLREAIGVRSHLKVDPEHGGLVRGMAASEAHSLLPPVGPGLGTTNAGQNGTEALARIGVQMGGEHAAL
jgi:hypothetical protein